MADQDRGRLTLRGIEIFLSVVEAGGMGHGARRVGAAASTVSQQIALLELSLGVTLIDRGAKAFSLTPAGRLFHARALTIVDEIGRARSELSAIDQSAVQELNLAVLEDVEGEVLPELLIRLAATFPQCNFVVRTGYSHSNLSALESRAADLVVMAGTDPLPETIEQHPIIRDPLIMVAAKGLIVDRENPLPVMKTAPMIRFNRSQVVARQIEAHLRRVRHVPPRRFEVETNTSMIALVTRACGWGLITPLGLLSAAHHLDGIDALPMPFPAASRTLSICARRDVMGALPGAVATVLRDVVTEKCVQPALEWMPWLAGDLRILEKDGICEA
ncbi:MAG: LysR family transcriptional regulator [Pseudomonadota bacterium]